MKTIFLDKDGLFGMRKFLAFTGGIVFHCLSIAVVVTRIVRDVEPLIPDKVLWIYAGIFAFYFGKEIFGFMAKKGNGN